MLKTLLNRNIDYAPRDIATALRLVMKNNSMEVLNYLLTYVKQVKDIASQQPFTNLSLLIFLFYRRQ